MGVDVRARFQPSLALLHGGAGYPCRCGARRGACLLCCPPALPLVCFFAPSPQPPSRREGGDQGFFHARGFAPCIPAAEPGRRWLSLPLWCPRGACLVGRLPPLPLVCLPAPIPPTPFPAGRGRPKVYFAGGSAPGTPGIKPPAALTEPAKRVPGVGLYPLRGGAGVAFRYPAVAWQLKRGSGEQCRQPRRGGTGGEELRRLRWSSPPGQGEQVPQGFIPLRVPQRQGLPATTPLHPPSPPTQSPKEQSSP